MTCAKARGSGCNGENSALASRATDKDAEDPAGKHFLVSRWSSSKRYSSLLNSSLRYSNSLLMSSSERTGNRAVGLRVGPYKMAPRGDSDNVLLMFEL